MQRCLDGVVDWGAREFHGALAGGRQVRCGRGRALLVKTEVRLDEVHLRRDGAVRECTAEAELEDRVKGRIEDVVLGREGPSMGEALLVRPQLDEVQRAGVDVGRSDPVEERRHHEVLQQSTMGLPHWAGLLVDVVVRRLAAQQLDGVVGAIPLFAPEHDVLGLAEVGDEDKGLAEGPQKQLTDGARMAAALVEQPVHRAPLVAHHGWCIAEEATHGLGVVWDSSDGLREKVAVQGGKKEGNGKDEKEGETGNCGCRDGRRCRYERMKEGRLRGGDVIDEGRQHGAAPKSGGAVPGRSLEAP